LTGTPSPLVRGTEGQRDRGRRQRDKVSHSVLYSSGWPETKEEIGQRKKRGVDARGGCALSIARHVCDVTGTTATTHGNLCQVPGSWIASKWFACECCTASPGRAEKPGERVGTY
jgi:hypothetical protein